MAHSDDLLSPEPEPEPEVVPAIPASAGALIFDRAGRLLILKPTYKSGWTIPGGVMEADGETPWEACQREVREECGLEVRTGRLACVDFRRPRPGRPGGMRFLFDCGALGDDRLGAVVLQPEEISEHRLVPLSAALTYAEGTGPAAGQGRDPGQGAGLPGGGPAGARGRPVTVGSAGQASRAYWRMLPGIRDRRPG